MFKLQNIKQPNKLSVRKRCTNNIRCTEINSLTFVQGKTHLYETARFRTLEDGAIFRKIRNLQAWAYNPLPANDTYNILIFIGY